MKKVILFYLVLFSSASFGEYDFEPFIYEFLAKPTEEWLTFCEQKKNDFKKDKYKYKLFSQLDQTELNGSEKIVNSVNFGGLLLPVIPSFGSLKTAIEVYGKSELETLRVKSKDYEIFIEQRPKEIYYDLWSAGETTISKEIELYKKMSNNFYPNGWDDLTLILEGHELTPNDLKCSAKKADIDMKILYLLSTKLGPDNTEIYNLNNKGLRGILTTNAIATENGIAINLQVIRDNRMNIVTYIFQNLAAYESVLNTILDMSMPLITSQGSTVKLEELVTQFEQYN